MLAARHDNDDDDDDTSSKTKYTFKIPGNILIHEIYLFFITYF